MPNSIRILLFFFWFKKLIYTAQTTKEWTHYPVNAKSTRLITFATMLIQSIAESTATTKHDWNNQHGYIEKPCHYIIWWTNKQIAKCVCVIAINCVKEKIEVMNNENIIISIWHTWLIIIWCCCGDNNSTIATSSYSYISCCNKSYEWKRNKITYKVSFPFNSQHFTSTSWSHVVFSINGHFWQVDRQDSTVFIQSTLSSQIGAVLVELKHNKN